MTVKVKMIPYYRPYFVALCDNTGVKYERVDEQNQVEDCYAVSKEDFNLIKLAMNEKEHMILQSLTFDFKKHQINFKDCEYNYYAHNKL